MIHTMRLKPSPFEKIRSKEKTIELRLYDEKRRKIRQGDQIRFVNTEDDTQVIEAKVMELYLFPDFKSLYEALPLKECGYSEEEVENASPLDMNEYYPPEEQRKYGVIAIQIRLL